MIIADDIRDGEILGLRGTTNGRSCEQHACWGAIVRPNDCVRFKAVVVPIDGVDQQVSRLFWSLMGRNCARLVSLARVLQLWRKQVTSLSTSSLKLLNSMTQVKMLPKGQKATITLEFVHSGFLRTSRFRNRCYENWTSLWILQPIYTRILIIVLEISIFSIRITPFWVFCSHQLNLFAY